MTNVIPDGYEIRPTPMLAGTGRGIYQGRVLCVPPAWWDLAKDATPAELDALLRSLKVLVLPEPIPLGLFLGGRA